MSDLVVTPQGWAPRSWAERLAHLAGVCFHVERAAELRAAAEAIEADLGPPRTCVICRLELGGRATGRPHDPGAIIDVDGEGRLACRVCAWRRERAPTRRRATA